MASLYDCFFRPFFSIRSGIANFEGVYVSAVSTNSLADQVGLKVRHFQDLMRVTADIFFHIFHQLKLYNTRYLLDFSQNTLQCYEFDTTRSDVISTLWLENRKDQNYIELLEKKIH